MALPTCTSSPPPLGGLSGGASLICGSGCHLGGVEAVMRNWCKSWNSKDEWRQSSDASGLNTINMVDRHGDCCLRDGTSWDVQVPSGWSSVGGGVNYLSPDLQLFNEALMFPRSGRGLTRPHELCWDPCGLLSERSYVLSFQKSHISPDAGLIFVLWIYGEGTASAVHTTDVIGPLGRHVVPPFTFPINFLLLWNQHGPNGGEIVSSLQIYVNSRCSASVELLASWLLELLGEFWENMRPNCCCVVMIHLPSCSPAWWLHFLTTVVRLTVIVGSCLPVVDRIRLKRPAA